MSKESTIYETGDIKITNLRAVFGNKTYSVSNITSVEKKVIAASGCGPLLLIGLGIAFVVSGATRTYNDSWPITVVIGIIIFSLGAKAARSEKPTYSVSLTTAGGEVKAFESTDEAVILSVVGALNDAITKKG